MSSNNTKTWQAATALSLGISGSLLMWSGTKLPTWMSRLSTMAIAAGVGYVAYKVHDSEKLAGADYLNASQSMWRMFEKEREQLGAVMVEFVPEPIKIRDVANDSGWVARSNRNWMLIFAKPEKGKTQVALQKMEAFIKSSQRKYRFQLIDFDFGKRGNTWGGFPKDAIIGAGEECANDTLKLQKAEQVIQEYYNEMIARSEKAAKTEGGMLQDDFDPWFLGIDEGASVIPKFKDEHTRYCLSELIRRGPGYNFSGFIIAQNPAVGELGLSEACKSQLAKFAVRPDATDQIGEFKLGGRAQDFIERCIDAEKNGKFAGIWHSEYGTELVYIPDRTANPVQFTTPASATDGWLSRINRNMLAKALSEGATKTHLWNMVLEQTELSGKDSKQLRSNPYYSKFIELWNELTAEPQTVEIEAELEAA